MDGFRAKLVPRPAQGIPRQSVRPGADHTDEDLPGGVRVRAEGGLGHTRYREPQGLYATAKEEEEASAVVDALSQDTAQERFRYVHTLRAIRDTESTIKVRGGNNSATSRC